MKGPAENLLNLYITCTSTKSNDTEFINICNDRELNLCITCISIKLNDTESINVCYDKEEYL